MKDIFAVENAIQLEKYQEFSQKYRYAIQEYCKFLEEQFAVLDFPNAIVWTSGEIATRDISSIPIPAYTNDYRTVFCPEPEVWKDIYLRQLDEINDPQIREYYETKLTENHILQILGHEFVHHSAFFPDADRECDIWFEEGMCEYISRKYFLTEDQFQEEARINARLVQLFQKKYGQHPLEDFGSGTYTGDYASIFCAYWRSFLAVSRIIDQHHGDIVQVLREYQKRIQGEE